MSSVIKLTLSSNEVTELQTKAKEMNMGVQDYIRSVLFNNQSMSIFTPGEAAKRAREFPKNKQPFSLPDLYTPDE